MKIHLPSDLLCGMASVLPRQSAVPSGKFWITWITSYVLLTEKEGERNISEEVFQMLINITILKHCVEINDSILGKCIKC